MICPPVPCSVGLVYLCPARGAGIPLQYVVLSVCTPVPQHAESEGLFRETLPAQQLSPSGRCQLPVGACGLTGVGTAV